MERGVDISVPHLVRTVRRFVDEEERTGGKGSPAPRGPASPAAKGRHPEVAAAEATTPKTRSRTRLLNNPVQKSRRRNLRSNCGWRGIWRRKARRLRGHWRRLASQERRKRAGSLQRRGLRPRRERSTRRLGRKNWRRKGGGRVGWVRRCRQPVRGEGRSSGRGEVVDSQATSRETGPWSVCRFLKFLGRGRSFETPKIYQLCNSSYA
jgi:hypothetical protein